MRNVQIDTLLGTERRTFYFLAEAAVVLGYRHPGTIRAKHLSNPEDSSRLGKAYHDGRVILDKRAVHQLAGELEKERSARGEYRLANLGRYATDLRPHRRKKALAPEKTGF